MASEELTIERATLDDADTYIEMHEEAARWLWEQGIRQWRPGAYQRERLIERIEAGDVYLAKRGAETLGAVILQWSDEYTWGAMPPDAGYIHGLCVRRSAAGQGLGRALITWAERQIAWAGRSYARLDCIANNHKLCAYYENAGYERQSDLVIEGERGALARFQKRVVEMDKNTIASGTERGDQLHIAQAQLGDVDTIVTIWNEADDWMRARGITAGEPPRPLREIVTERVNQGETYVAKRDGHSADEVVGTITLAWADDGVWGDDAEADSDAVYAHGLATKRSHAGEGIGQALLAWAEGVAHAAKRSYLRLDCAGDNPALCAYYERVGFTRRGDIQLAHRLAARFEKRV